MDHGDHAGAQHVVQLNGACRLCSAMGLSFIVDESLVGYRRGWEISHRYERICQSFQYGHSALYMVSPGTSQVCWACTVSLSPSRQTHHVDMLQLRRRDRVVSVGAGLSTNPASGCTCGSWPTGIVAINSSRRETEGMRDEENLPARA